MHRYAQNQKRLHFGLGPNTNVDHIEIRWPSGIVQTIANISSDQILTVIEPYTNNIATANNDAASVNEGFRVNIDVAENDTDEDDRLDLGSVKIVSGPGNGNISAINSDGTVDYTHNGSETVSDSFSYTIDDLSGATYNVALVSITVNPQNDAPVARDDSGSVVIGAAVTIDLSANDTDVDNALDPNSIQIARIPANGSVSVNTDGSVTYTPSSVPGETTDTFTYTISDQTGALSNTAMVTVAINPADSNNDGISDIKATALGLAVNDPDGDTDNDFISDIVEVGSSIDNPLDSDGDGIIDALEPGSSAADATLADGLPLDGNGSVRITTAAGETLSDVASDRALGGPTGIDFPFGVLGYTTTAPVGGNVTVRLNFSNRLPANLALFKVDHAGIFKELPHAVWTQVDPRTLDITLTDGDPVTDLDGTANGAIEDPIAVGNIAASSTPVASPDSGSGGGGCTLTAGRSADPGLPVLLLASLGYLLRKRALSRKKRCRGKSKETPLAAKSRTMVSVSIRWNTRAVSLFND